MSIKVGEIYAAYKTEGWDAFRKEITGSERLMAGAAIGMVASMAAITAAVVKIGMPFENMVLEAGSAMRATQAEMERLEAAARQAGATTEHTATAAAESLKFLGKAGLSARESMESLGGMLNFKTAIGSIMDLGRATDVITDSMIAMGLETKDLTHLTDLFVGASNRSSTNAAQIGEAFSKVAGIAKVYGMEVETLTATLAIQASAGIKSGIAGRQLKNAFANTSKAAHELGIENKGLIPTIEAVAKAGWDADKVMSVYGKIAMPSVVAIMSSVSGTEKGSFAYMLNEMMHVSDGMGETAEQAEKMRASVENQFAIVTSMIQDIALSIFDDWKPAMLEGIKTTQEFLRENKKAIVEVGDVLLPVLQKIGTVIQAGAWIGTRAIGMLNAEILGSMSNTMRLFIEIEYAAKLAFAGMQTAFGAVVWSMLQSFATFTTGMSAAFKLMGGFDIAGPLDRATMKIKEAARGTDKLTGAFARVGVEREKAIAVHKKVIDEIALEHQGYTTTADESRKAAESVLADIRKKDEASGGYTRKQIADMNAVSEKAIIEADARLKTDQEFYAKSGMMSADVHKEKLAEIDAAVTRFRLGSSTEIQIQAWKAKEIDKLNKKSVGKTTKQLAAESKAVEAAVKRDLKAREKGVEERLKIEFGWLDKMEESTDKEIKALEKSLGKSRDAYEKYIKEKTGLKELSVETEARLDEEYSELLWKTLQGDTENFTESQKAMVSGKEFSIAELKKYDTEYSAFLAEQEAANKDIRLEFYGTAGNFSQEYYDTEIQRINAHSAELAAAGVAAVDVERAKTDAILALDIKKLESSDKFVDGVALGLAKSQQDFTTWADVGMGTYKALESGLATGFSTLFNSVIKGDMDSLSGSWESLWQGMLGKVTDILGQMAAEYAAAGIAKGAMAAAEWIFAEKGAFDIGRDGPGTAMAGGGIPIMAHPGESILPAGLTEDLKTAVNYDSWKAKAQDYFGITPEGPPSGIGAAADYSAAGASLYKAYLAFEAGDNTGTAMELSRAFAAGFETYAAQNASQIAAGLGEVSGGIGSGIAAWQSFQNDDYVGGTMQALQALQQGAAAYETFTAGAGAATSTAGATAAGTTAPVSLSTSIGGILQGAGYGAAAWSLFAMAGDEHMQSSAATIGATIGATAGAAIGSVAPGIGNIVGGVGGAFVGGLIGTVGDVARGGTATFELNDYNAEANAARTWTSDGFAGRMPAVEGDVGSAEDNSRNAYFKAMNLSMDTATGVIAAANEILSPEQSKEFQDIFSANLDPVAVRGDMNWMVGEAGQGTSTASKIAATYWNDTMDALETAALSVGGADMAGLAQWASLNMLSDTIDPTGATQAAKFEAGRQEVLAQMQRERMATGGAATGGVVVPSGEDGILGVKKEEGIFSVAAMQWAEDVGNTILKTGGVFGGTEARFDSPGMGTPVGGADIFGGSARGAQMSELLLNDQVTRQGRTNTILESQISEIRRTNTILENIVNVLLEGDEEKIRTLKAIVAKPPGVTKYDLNPLFTMSRVYMAQPRSNFGFG